MAYTIETIIAEKFESIISKNITTTRAKDFYDIFMLVNKNRENINNKNLVKAIENTFNKRNTKFDLNYFKEIIELLKESNALRKVFSDYQQKLEYTKNINYDDTVKSIFEIVEIIESELVKV